MRTSMSQREADTIHLFPDGVEGVLTDVSNFAIRVRKIVFNVKSESMLGRRLVPTRWVQRSDGAEEIVRFVSRSSDLRVIELQLKCDYSLSDLGAANAICHAFLQNKSIAEDEKEIRVKVRIKDGLWVEALCQLLSNMSRALTALEVDDTSYTEADNCGISEMIATSIASLPRLRDFTEEISYIRPIYGTIYQHLASSRVPGRIQTMRMDPRLGCIPNQFSGFLLSENASNLENLELRINEGLSVSQTEHLVNALSHRTSIKKLSVTVDLRGRDADERSRLLARYFSQVKLESLEIAPLVYEEGAGHDLQLSSVRNLLFGLQSNMLIAELDVKECFPGRGSEVMRSFLRCCQIKKLKLAVPQWDEPYGRAVAEGLLHNRWLRHLEILNVHERGSRIEPVIQVLSLQERAQDCPAVESVHLDCFDTDEDADMSRICDFVRCPITSLKFIHLRVVWEDERQLRMRALLHALAQSTGLDGFHLDAKGIGDGETCFALMAEFLPRLEHISSLALNINQSASLDMKMRLYWGALPNSGITSLTFCQSDDADFENLLHSICVRNKAGKVAAGLLSGSTRLGPTELTQLIQDLRRESEDIGICPDPFAVTVMFAWLRTRAWVETN